MVGRYPINQKIGAMTPNQRKVRERAKKKALGLSSTYIHQETWLQLCEAIRTRSDNDISNPDNELILSLAIKLVNKSNIENS